MFENLSERLSGVFDRLTKQGALSEEDVKTALREVRVALLEADVSLPVARAFVKKVQEQARQFSRKRMCLRQRADNIKYVCVHLSLCYAFLTKECGS